MAGWIDADGVERWGARLAKIAAEDGALAEHELNAFLERAQGWTPPRRASWVRAYCEAQFDAGLALPLPARLARTFILPELARGVREGLPGHARWMAQIPHALDPHREAAGLPAGAGLREALLERALTTDPRDDDARRLLLAHLRSQLDWACDGDAPRADPTWIAARALRVAELRRDVGEPAESDVAHWLGTAVRWASRRASV